MKYLYLLILFIFSCTGTIHAPPFHNPCGHIFSPEDSLKSQVIIATERWSKATGCEITVGEGGTPINRQDRIYTILGESEVYTEPGPDRRENCGVYVPDDDIIFMSSYINNQCPVYGEDGVAAHEIGHVLAGRGGHAPDGVLAIPSKDKHNRLITESSLLWVCMYQKCQNFIPETDWNLILASHPELALRTLDD